MNAKANPIKKKELIKPVSVGMTDPEKDVIIDAAKKAGVSFSDFVRQSALRIAAEV